MGESKEGFRTETLIKDEDNEKEAYLRLAYETETKCVGDESKMYGITYNMICDSSADTETYTLGNDDECHPVIDFTSSKNCHRLDINALWKWVQQYYWISAIAMFVIGAFEWSLGQKMFRPTLFIVGLLSTLGVILFIFYAWFLPHSNKSWTVWLIGTIGLGLGIVVGFFL